MLGARPTLLALCMTAAVACGPPSNGLDPMFAADTGTTLSPGGEADGAPGEESTDSTGALGESSSEGVEPPADSDAPPATDGAGEVDGDEGSTDGGGSTGEGSTGGEVAEGFDACPDADQATCAGAPQCVWQEAGPFGEVPAGCAPNPLHCARLDQVGCESFDGCAWAGDNPLFSGCSTHCADLDQAICDAIESCVWFDGDLGGQCVGGG